MCASSTFLQHTCERVRFINGAPLAGSKNQSILVTIPQRKIGFGKQTWLHCNPSHHTIASNLSASSSDFHLQIVISSFLSDIISNGNTTNL
jgi:hypothetical protein